MVQAAKYIWMDGELVPWDEATVHVLSHGLHYGTGVFEGIRAYETEDGGTAIFRHDDHMIRLVNSARAYGIPCEWSADDLAKAARETIAANELRAGYIRPLIFYGLGSMGLNPAGAETRTIIATWFWGAYLGEEGLANGIRVAVSSWRRISHEGLIPNAKGTGGYLNSVMAKQEAIRNGYDEALMLNTAGYLAEGSGENLFLVYEDRVVTPPTIAGALQGITRDTVMKLLHDEGHDIVERNISRSDLYYADEAFFTGTAAEVTPIREIDGRSVGSGKPGPITKRVQDLYMDVVSGRIDRYRHWLDFV